MKVLVGIFRFAGVLGAIFLLLGTWAEFIRMQSPPGGTSQVPGTVLFQVFSRMVLPTTVLCILLCFPFRCFTDGAPYLALMAGLLGFSAFCFYQWYLPFWSGILAGKLHLLPESLGWSILLSACFLASQVLALIALRRMFLRTNLVKEPPAEPT